MPVTKLVVGASGFLGSHVARQLVGAGETVRVMIRPTSSTRAIDDLDVEVRLGDIFDNDALRQAMAGCDVVYHCVVDARPWLRDPTPMYRTNVEGLRNVLDAAVEAGLTRFVYTSSIGTIGLTHDGLADETTPHRWLDRGGDYIRSRVEAENLVMAYHRDKGLPAVAMCVANTYGSGDYLPTPHGGLLAAAVRGTLPFYVRGAAAEVVGIDDAAEALILAGRHGRPGQRYIVSERFMTARQIYQTACAAVGVEPPRYGVPLGAMSAMATVAQNLSRLTGRGTRLTPLTVRLMHIMTPLDHTKAVRELHWNPRPATDAIAEAGRFFLAEKRTPPRPSP